MFLKSLRFKGFRNLESSNIDLNKRLNVFHGKNGAGKSSILEAIALLSSGRSFRTSKLDLIPNDKEAELLLFGLIDEDWRVGISYNRVSKQKTIKLNGEKVKALSSLSKLYPTQVLSPESYHLVDSGPSERRKYLDWLLFHVEHNYHDYWKTYHSVLKQRNALLRSSHSLNKSNELSVWNSQLIEAANLITTARNSLMSELKETFEQITPLLGNSACDGVKLSYYEGYKGCFADRLEENHQKDLESGFTRAGPHKADLRIKVEGHLAKDFLSRGQKKVLINALYLAQTAILKKRTNKDSLFVIDDFTAELDLENQQALLQMLMQQNNVQIILSCLHLESLNWLKKGYNTAHMFHVEHGTVNPEEPFETN